ncbi:hypothetical protein [Methanococcoides sp. LMO-2]|uniref:Uncharacterized protein n=1 Tax=Methanococcoides cohabitans TaxID=3136559 RepID=A0ABU9KVK3_9EURY
MISSEVRRVIDKIIDVDYNNGRCKFMMSDYKVLNISINKLLNSHYFDNSYEALYGCPTGIKGNDWNDFYDELWKKINE